MNSSQAHRRLVDLGAVLDRDHMIHIDFVCIESGPPCSQHVHTIKDLPPTHIALDGSRFTESDADALAMLPNLTCICASNGTSPALFVKNIQLFPKLESLALSWTSICDEDLSPLRDNHSLLSINLAHTEIGNASLTYIGSIANLELLDLRHTRVDDTGLADLFRLRNLFTVDLRDSSVTTTGQQTLTDALKPWLPDIEILI